MEDDREMSRDRRSTTPRREPSLSPPPPRGERNGSAVADSRQASVPKPRHAPDNPEPTKIVGVFGLSVRTVERDLEEEFGRVAPVEKVVIVYDARTQRSRGFGFITMRDVEGAADVIKELNGIDLHGRRLRVDYSVTHKPHDPTPGEYRGEIRRDERVPPPPVGRYGGPPMRGPYGPPPPRGGYYPPPPGYGPPPPGYGPPPPRGGYGPPPRGGGYGDPYDHPPRGGYADRRRPEPEPDNWRRRDRSLSPPRRRRDYSPQSRSPPPRRRDRDDDGARTPPRRRRDD